MKSISVSYTHLDVYKRQILDQVIQNGKAVDANSYTAESYAVLTAALATAEEVYNNDNATQDEVDTAVENVQAAIKGLVAVDGATNGGTSATDNNATPVSYTHLLKG